MYNCNEKIALFNGDHILFYFPEIIETMPFVINVNSLTHFLDLPKMLPCSQLGCFDIVFDCAVGRGKNQFYEYYINGFWYEN